VPVERSAGAAAVARLNVVILLPLIARTILLAMQIIGASPAVTAATAVLYIPFVAAGFVLAVWHWRYDMAAWLEGMVSPRISSVRRGRGGP